MPQSPAAGLRPVLLRRRRRLATEDALKILVIEDDCETADYVSRGLREQGHVVDVTTHGRDGLFRAVAGAYDPLIADRMLPGLDGLALVKTIRGAGLTTP